MTVGPTVTLPPHRFTKGDGGARVLTVDLPSLKSLDGVDLDIGSAELRLLLPGNEHFVRIPLPCDISTSSGSPAARFSRKRGQLTIAWSSETNPAENSVALAAQTPEIPSVPALAAQAPAPAAPVGPPAPVKSSSSERTSCIGLLEDEVEHALKQCTIEKLKQIQELGGASILLDGFSVKGTAYITDRTCCFNASVSFTWDVLDAFGGMLGVTGSGHVSDLTQTSVAPKVLAKVSSCTRSTPQARAAGDWMKHQGAHFVSESLKGADLSSAILSAELPAGANEGVAQPLDALTTRTVFQGGSMTQWAETWMVEKLGSLTVRLFGGVATAFFCEPRVYGEASASAGDGRPDVFFKLRVECEWIVTPAGGKNPRLAGVGANDSPTKDARGTLVVPDFTSKKGAKACAVDINVDRSIKYSGQLVAAFRQDGVSALRTLLANFASELTRQCACPDSIP